ncbi:MAG: hypothetical protein J5643_09240 [Lachnospiraceae bacterium]|nr:hypothetical protein [Lachnospiraceae bacterium]
MSKSVKKLIVTIGALAVCFALFGCTPKNPGSGEEHPTLTENVTPTPTMTSTPTPSPSPTPTPTPTPIPTPQLNPYAIFSGDYDTYWLVWDEPGEYTVPSWEKTKFEKNERVLWFHEGQMTVYPISGKHFTFPNAADIRKYLGNNAKQVTYDLTEVFIHLDERQYCTAAGYDAPSILTEYVLIPNRNIVEKKGVKANEYYEEDYFLLPLCNPELITNEAEEAEEKTQYPSFGKTTSYTTRMVYIPDPDNPIELPVMPERLVTDERYDDGGFQKELDKWVSNYTPVYSIWSEFGNKTQVLLWDETHGRYVMNYDWGEDYVVPRYRQEVYFSLLYAPMAWYKKYEITVVKNPNEFIGEKKKSLDCIVVNGYDFTSTIFYKENCPVASVDSTRNITFPNGYPDSAYFKAAGGDDIRYKSVIRDEHGICFEGFEELNSQYTPCIVRKGGFLPTSTDAKAYTGTFKVHDLDLTKWYNGILKEAKANPDEERTWHVKAVVTADKKKMADGSGTLVTAYHGKLIEEKDFDDFQADDDFSAEIIVHLIPSEEEGSPATLEYEITYSFGHIFKVGNAKAWNTLQLKEEWKAS